MDALNKILRKGQLTIPTSIRKELRLEEGQYVKMTVEDGALVVKPVKIIDNDQSYIFSDSWQKKIKHAQDNYEKGAFKKATSVDQLMEGLSE